ncbi:MAG: MBL fold metallo-hydrolase [Gammaproteobacteria bacterium]|nr:MBL fold metallo-hydrolase [Gammaproteobacteria bacterium]
MHIPTRRRILPAIFILLGMVAGPATAQEEDRFKNVQIETIQVAEGVYMLVGEGGNIGVSAGEDGVFLIDDQFAPLTGKIKAAVAKISDKPVRFVLNTHWHGDHTGGNENLGKEGVVIVAHDNVFSRMAKENFMEAFNLRVPPAPKAALPVISFNDTVTFHLNSEEIHTRHYARAHTDGDSVVHFRGRNVVHTGDIFFNQSYPLIDVSSGGSIDGVIASVKDLLTWIDGKAKIIPGHGPLADRKALEGYLEFLTTVRARIGDLIDEGRTLEEAVAARPLADFDATLGKGFLTTDRFVEIIYKGLAAKP